MANMERLARAYGIQVDDLLEVLTLDPLDADTVHVPVRGYIEAGLPRDSYEVDLGVIPLARSILGDRPRAFSLITSGDSLTVDGIHNEDMLIVDPDTQVMLGSLCIVRVGSTLCGTSYVGNQDFQFRTPTGRSENLHPSDIQVLGNVVLHFRRM